MKATIAAISLGLLACGSAQAGMKYECWTYKGGSPDKMTYVVADNNAQAVQLAIAKFRGMGVAPSNVTCK